MRRDDVVRVDAAPQRARRLQRGADAEPHRAEVGSHGGAAQRVEVVAGEREQLPRARLVDDCADRPARLGFVTQLEAFEVGVAQVHAEAERRLGVFVDGDARDRALADADLALVIAGRVPGRDRPLEHARIELLRVGGIRHLRVVGRASAASCRARRDPCSRPSRTRERRRHSRRTPFPNRRR